MEPVALPTALLAAFAIVSRAPLVFAPTATIEIYHWVIASPIRIRTLGVLLGSLAAAFVVTAPAAREAHGWIALGLEGLGWGLVAVTAWLLIAPKSYRRVVESFVSVIDDETTWRVLGAIGVGGGLALAWLALAVL